jgi:two-component system response regulator PilR (NtrC family)
VRELENTLERAMTLCNGMVIEAESLHLQSPSSPAPAKIADGINQDLPKRAADQPLEDFLQDIERQEILKALDATHWNRTAAAKKLGMTFRSLRYRLKKLELDRDDGSE